jgi:hypothetical protein
MNFNQLQPLIGGWGILCTSASNMTRDFCDVINHWPWLSWWSACSWFNLTLKNYIYKCMVYQSVSILWFYTTCGCGVWNFACGIHHDVIHKDSWEYWRVQLKSPVQSILLPFCGPGPGLVLVFSNILWKKLGWAGAMPGPVYENTMGIMQWFLALCTGVWCTSNQYEWCNTLTHGAQVISSGAVWTSSSKFFLQRWGPRTGPIVTGQGPGPGPPVQSGPQSLEGSQSTPWAQGQCSWAQMPCEAGGKCRKNLEWGGYQAHTCHNLSWRCKKV